MMRALRHGDRLARRLAAVVLAAALAACASGSPPPTPTPLKPVANILTVKSVWTRQIGPVPGWFRTAVVRDGVIVASRDGQLTRIDTASGHSVWTQSIKGGISAGVGSDGTFTAVVDQTNGLVSLGPKGQLLWRYQLPTSVLTAPLVVDGRIVVQGADQRLWAFDAANGKLLWQADNRAPALLVQQAGGLLAGPQGTVLVGTGLGRIDAYELANGLPRWQATLARPRGVTEVERVVGITGPMALHGDTVCARAFQSAVGCVDATTGRVLWTRDADGGSGVSVDARELVGTDSNGTVQAYALADGAPQWSNAELLWRSVSAPLLVGRTVVVGDYQGAVSFLSAKDGSIVGRVSTDGSAIQVPPVVVGKTLVVVTAKGGVYAYVPD